MKNITKTLMVCFIVAVALALVGTTATAVLQIPGSSILSLPSFTSQPLTLPYPGLNGDILVDNFEYWDSPYNHGWFQVEPAYPTYGFGMGYATIFNTVLDLQHGSLVLDVYRPMSVFLLGPTPTAPYAKHHVQRGLGVDLVTHGTVSFSFRAPLGIEPWDIFTAAVIGTATADGYTDRPFQITISPTQNCVGCQGSGNNLSGADDGTPWAAANVTTVQDDASALVLNVDIGRGFLDGSWHVVWLDLGALLGNPTEATAALIDLSGQMFRFDNLMFRVDEGHTHLDYPDFFEMGPLYAQIFEPYRYIFHADYAGQREFSLADPANPNDCIGCANITEIMNIPGAFITDPNTVQSTLIADGADPNFFYSLLDPNTFPGTDTNGDGFPNADPNFGIVFDPLLPIFADPNMRAGGSEAAKILGQGVLLWNTTIGGYGSSGVQSFLLEPLAINPYDGLPTYLGDYYDSIETALLYGKPSYPPAAVATLGSALYNIGLSVWPMVAYMDYVPQVFEDLIISLEVTNGVHSDMRTFPISVVNYPVENYPPVLQLDIDDQIFYVGGDPADNAYLINFIDPDCFIFSLAQQPSTTHTIFPARDDMSALYWQASLNGLPSYQFGPWMNSIIDPCTGIISFQPQFEGAYDLVVTCTDNRGASAVGEVTIFAVQCGTWLNHPPIILGGPTQPVVLRAGEEFTLHAPNFDVEDPDGDEIYASCNIGSCGRDVHGDFIWTFQTNFPGSYAVEIVFYDIRGGYAIMEFFVDVKPWWSFSGANQLGLGLMGPPF
jgi:hypothetical protein